MAGVVDLGRARAALNAERAQELAAAATTSEHQPRSRRGAFAGARISPTNAWPFAGIRSIDSEILGDLTALRGASRDFARNTPFGIRFIRLFADNVIGENGYNLRVQTGDPAADVEVMDAFEEWSEDQHCSVDGSLGWVELQRAVAMNEPQDGEFLLRMVPGFDNPFGFALQQLSPDLLDHTLNEPRRADGTSVRMGIRRNGWSRALEYLVWSAHTSDTRWGGGERQLIPIQASDIRHGFERIGTGQSRGVPWFFAVLRDGGTLDGFIEAAAVNARLGAEHPAFLQSDDDYEDEEAGSEASDELDDYAPASLGGGPGSIRRLPPKHSLITPEWRFPDSSFDPFVTAMLMHMSAGLHTSHGALSGDLRHANYGSMRVGMLTDHRAYGYHQRRYRRGVHLPVFHTWARMSFIAGRIRTRPERLRLPGVVQFEPPVQEWIDPDSETKAMRAEMEAGILTATKAAAKRGRNIRQIIQERKKEIEICEQEGVDPSILYAFKAPPAPPPEPATKGLGR